MLSVKFVMAVSAVVAAYCSFAGEEYPELPRRITDETEEQRAERMSWWIHDRFGMFIHFGLYSVPARHEWVKTKEAIDDKVYNDRYLPRFNPDLYDADAWVSAAKKAGMKYIVLTTKHHEGFCMWDTATTDYKITNTDFKRDLVREFVDACRRAGMRVGFYFSLKDWHHPDYTVDATHPINARFKREGLKDDDLRKAMAKANEGRSMERFRKVMFAQVEELLTRYGKIDVIWYDYTAKKQTYGEFGRSYRDWDAVNLLKLTRKLQPAAIVDNRLDLMDTDDGWDFVSPEQFKAKNWPTVRGKKVPWETCQTFSGSWGYYRDEETWKSIPQLVSLLTETVSKGGNLILNVGPTARGEFDGRAKERLDGIANWMHFNSRSIYGCTVAPEGFNAPNGTVLTYNPETRRLYVHLDEYPMGFLPVDWFDRIEYAQFLHDGSELKLVPPPTKVHMQSGDTGFVGGIELPVRQPDVVAPVIEIWLKPLS